jgi:RNA polymerase sporulation-specific sigma factor
MDTRLVRILARKYANANLTEEDLVQEGMLAWIKAETTFKPETGVKFETYASRVIRNRFIDLLRKRPAGKSAVLCEESTSGDYHFDDEVDLIEIHKIIDGVVKPLDRAIFNSYIEGFTYEEIGKIFNLTRKKIDNTVQKVKKLIKSKY